MTEAMKAMPGAWAGETSATFRLADPVRELAGVRLEQDVRIPADQLIFGRTGDNWELVVKRPPVSRMEYRLELTYQGGCREVVLDPANPLRVAAACGARSVLEFPGYVPPAWLSAPINAVGASAEFEMPAPSLGAQVPVRLWKPADVSDEEPLPLLVVHDGPEYDSMASLTRYLSAGVRSRWLPPLRAALLGPGERDDWYSANPRYARALRRAVLPALASRVAISVRIGMGTSLGALALLHAQVRYPDGFDALFLQSGSYFTPRLDPQERRFPYYRRIVGFVGHVHDGTPLSRAVPTVLTCGAIEENAENNRLMTQTLRARGYDIALHEVPDMHNYTAWRDAFDPYLTGLIQRVC